MLKTLPSDDRIENISNTELYWLAAMINKDGEEEFLQRRNELEYLASFINPQAVSKIKEIRENTKSVSDEDFATIIAGLSERNELPNYQTKNGD